MPDNRRDAATLVIAATIDVFWLGKTASDVRWITQIAVFRAQIDNFVSRGWSWPKIIHGAGGRCRTLERPRLDPLRCQLTHYRTIR